MSSSTTDTRDEVMQAPDLFELFCTRSAEDFKPATESGASGMALALFASFSVIAWIAGSMFLAKASLAVFLLLLLVAAWTLVVKSPTRAIQMQDSVRRGLFPPESAPIVLARLRWWNHLVTPAKWARQSRIHDRRFKLDRRIQETGSRLDELRRQHQESQQRLDAASATASLAGKVRTLAERDTLLKRLGQIEDELPRLAQEMVLYESLREKIKEVTDRLEQLEQLAATLYDAGSDLSRTVGDALSMLEQRRRIVRELDDIDPEDFLRMITF